MLTSVYVGRNGDICKNCVCDVFKALEEIKAQVKLCCSLITVSNISVCVSVLFFSFLLCMSFCIYTRIAREKIRPSKAAVNVCP